MFYNGEVDPGQITEYRLLHMFEKNEETPELEFIVKVININEGFPARAQGTGDKNEYI